MIRPFLLNGLITVITLSLRVSGQDLQFYREDILFTIDGNSAQTDAEYYFCNVREKNIMMRLFYPFPENTIELIDSLVVENLQTNATIPYRKSGSGIFFDIHVKSFGQSAYRVYFRQQLWEDHFVYILKSTSSWGRPLEFANYELRMPISLILDSLSYPPDTLFLLNDIRFYKWKKTDFMPNRDFELFFH